MRIFYEINEEDTRPHILKFNKFVEKNFPQLLTEENPELVLCTGGDGSLLKALSKWGKKGVPVLGRSAGTVNFLLNDFKKRDKKILKNLINDEIKLDYVESSSIKIYLNGSKLKEKSINDVVIGDGIMDWQKFKINTEDQYLKDFDVNGAGLCISTPVGSTGYNFNNKGKVLKINNRKNKYSSLWSLTDIAANRDLDDILFEQKIDIEILTLEERHNCYIFIDGQKYEKNLSNGDTITLKPGKKYKMAFLDKHVFFQKRINLELQRK